MSASQFFGCVQSTCVPVRNMQIVRQCGVRMQFAVGKGVIRLIKNILFNCFAVKVLPRYMSKLRGLGALHFVFVVLGSVL